MDGVSSAASVIAVIQLTGSLVKLCGGYIQQVRDARDEIFTLQRAIISLQGVVQDLHKFLRSDTGKDLPTSSQLASNVTACLSDLRALEAKLDQGKGIKMMRKVGFRALKWPLKRTEVESIVQNLERYKSSFTLSLQVDQTSLMFAMAQDIDIGKLERVADAEFDSFSDRDEVECLQGTRVELLKQIREWATFPCPKIVFWLNGMAGTGKSTISRTVAKSLKDTNHLGASFFFKRGEGDRGNAKKFFPTLVRQLVLRISNLSPGVQKALRNDPAILSKSLEEQFDKLLLQPLLELDRLGQQTQTAVIVIDALDECDHDPDIRNIIRLLPILQKAKTLRLPVFLTSRPELSIRLGFSEIANHDHQDVALHEISEKVTEHDIRLYFQDRFTKIRFDRMVSEGWPSEDVIHSLVTMSVPLFISAATVCRYIENARWEPKRRLTELLHDQARYATKMDKTYLPILSRLLDDQDSDEIEEQQLLQEFQEIVGTTILLAIPFSVNTLSRFLGIDSDLISNRLDSFRSVLSVPTNWDLPVRILHLSFRDFLVQSKSKFLVKESSKHMEIAFNCLKTMRSHLQKDICNLKHPGTRRADIDPLSLRQYFPPELEYSCRYWVHHLKYSGISSSKIEDISCFLQEHLLHWVEAMSLQGLISDVVKMMSLLQRVIPGERHCALLDFLHDAKRFILKNRQIADEAPLQLYCAGLIFAPQTAIIRREFKSELPTWIYKLPQVEESWSAEILALEGHSGSVLSVTISPDSRLLASSSHDQTVRLWDTATGALYQTLEGHTDWVRSVAFSPDGRLLASGSNDETVRLWDTATNTLQRKLEGKLGWVVSVAFAPDGRLLAAGSNDGVIRLWDPATGALHRELKGHADWVRLVTFSPDGLLLASCSDDEKICLWDTATGTLHQTLEGRPSWVLSVSFSPDRRLLASGSEDQVVSLWDIATGTLLQTLQGHTGLVWSVAFSPDGRLLASSSDDQTIRLWDARTGVLNQTLEGHTDSVRSVAFSPDNRLLASGSNDQIVRLWDTATGALNQTLESHADWVRSVEFSSDGRLLASGSDDQLVRCWDTATGTLLQTLESHTGPVWSVAFSPDGRLLASGSDDQMVCIWETATGVLHQKLKGHTGWVRSVSFSPDGRLLASGSDDQMVCVWETATGVLHQKLKGHTGWVRSVSFSPDGQLLASGSGDQTVYIWDTATGVLHEKLEGHAYSVRSVAFSPDGKLLASGSSDQTVSLWDVVTGSLQHTWSVLGIVEYLKFSPDGAYLITNFGDVCIQSRGGISSSISHHMKRGISIEHTQWIRLNGEKVLWLPAEFRPSCFAINGRILALGHASGRISTLSFCI